MDDATDGFMKAIKWRIGDGKAIRFWHLTNFVIIWNGILDATDGFMKAIRWRVGDGKAIRFWHDHWLDYHSGGQWEILLRRTLREEDRAMLVDLHRELNEVRLEKGVSDYPI
ncbi:hypothetical protein QJS10_CPB20g00475 [Acorus calamus]|uniref:Uncharacterized protein n=1 Tax=Acorus calamus TaxID=4465 RepID=A0AAV9CB80_ACOCL|nr:hypothetical protein QJS10_CPB20g00475 [Acorus calamus]